MWGLGRWVKVRPSGVVTVTMPVVGSRPRVQPLVWTMVWWRQECIDDDSPFERPLRESRPPAIGRTVRFDVDDVPEELLEDLWAFSCLIPGEVGGECGSVALERHDEVRPVGRVSEERQAACFDTQARCRSHLEDRARVDSFNDDSWPGRQSGCQFGLELAPVCTPLWARSLWVGSAAP